MASEELLAALRSDGEKKAAAIWQEAEAAAARLREEAADRREGRREECRQAEARAVAAETSTILAEGEREARKIRLAALAKLAERLQEQARRLLPRLRTADYPALFAWLVAELPPADWVSVRVNPADGELAAAAFPATRLVVDPAIAGGLEVLAEEGRIQVTNTLEKRLERAWPGLLPALLGDLENHA